MNKSDLKKMSKSQLIKMLLKQEKPNVIKPAPNKVVYNHENLFEDDPFPDFIGKVVKNNPFEKTMKKLSKKEKRIKKNSSKIDKKYQKLMSNQKTKIEETNKALKGYTKSYKINIKNNKDPLVQLQKSQKAIAKHIKNLL